MPNPTTPSESAFHPVPAPARPRRRFIAAAALIGAFAVGASTTSLVQSRHPASVIALSPAPITAMHERSPVAVKGRVAEIFGNKFVVEDETGRALVETGRAGESGTLVATSETITVQGRFEHGFIHAVAISHADGRSDLVGPPGPPPGGLLSWRDGGIGHWFGRSPAPQG